MTPVDRRAGSAARPEPAVAVERSRRACVRLIFALYLLYLIEGMLRKWLLPQFSDVLFFLRDPVTLWLYTLAFSRGLVRVRGWLLAWIAVMLVTSSIGLVPLAAQGIGPLGWALAIRSYWLYLPLAFVVGSVFTREDLRHFILLNLAIALPVAILVLVQYRSPPDAFVNRALHEDTEVVTVIAGMVRPYGLFTYTNQHVFYTGSVLALLALAWASRRDIRIPLGVLIASTGATLAMSLTTGTRTMFFFMIFIGLALLAVPIVARNARGARRSSLVFLVLFVAAGAILFPTLLRPAMEAMAQRQAGAVASEGSTLGRALHGFTSFVAHLSEVPLLGHGLGVGTSTVGRLATGGQAPVAAEDEWARIVEELGPALALALISVRCLFTVWLLGQALRAAREGRPDGLVLLGFVGAIVPNGQITFSTIQGYVTWLFVGLILAARRTEAPAPAPSPTRRGGKVPLGGAGRPRSTAEAAR